MNTTESLCSSLESLQNSVQFATRQAMYVLRNSEARPCNHWWSGKWISVTYSECVFEALSLQHAMRMHNIISPSVACLTLPCFSTSRFSRKKLLNIKYIFWLSLQFSSEMFLILRRTAGFHTKYPSLLPDFNESWLFSTDIWKIYEYQI